MSNPSPSSVTNPGAKNTLDCVWEIRIEKENNTTSQISGARIEGYRLLTCYHGFLPKDIGITKIKARRSGKNYFDMEIAFSMPERDLVTLKFKGNQVPVSPYLELSHNETLDVGDEISVAGYDNSGLDAKKTDAQVVCSCIPVDPSNFSDNARYVPTPEEHPSPRPYPIMHNVLNLGAGEDKGIYDYNPNIPLILINEWGFCCHGRSGGPVYRADQKIVGVFIGGSAFGAWAVHLSAVRDFLRRAEIGDKTFKSALKYQRSKAGSSSGNKPSRK